MVRVGLQLPSYSFPGGAAEIAPRLIEIAQAAEAAGFASLWVMDHYFQLPEDTGWGGAGEPMLEAYTTLGFLARATERIALGPLVAGATNHHPGLLIKTATTLDVLAGGRTYLGLGAGWYAREARGLGVPWPERRERFERLEETLQVAHLMWAGEARPFEGRHYRLDEPITVPMPLSRPRPRLMVGGNGPRRTMRLVARYADACNILVPDPGESRRLLERLRAYCEEESRAFEDVEKSALIEADLRPGHQSATDVLQAIRAQGDEGIEHVIVNMPEVWDLRHIATFGHEIIPAAIRG